MPPSKPKLALLVNLIAPYRVPLYKRLAECFELSILHGRMEKNRGWKQADIPGALDCAVWGWQFAFNLRRSGRAFDPRFFHIEPGYLTELLRIHPDAIVTIELGIRTLIALAYGFLFRTPVWVWWGGTLHTERNLSFPRRFLRRVAARTVRHWISYGESSTEYLLSLGISRASILQIQNCVDESWYGTSARPAVTLLPKPVLLHVGRLTPLKGVRELLRAAAQLQAEGSQFSLLLVGDGSDLAELKALAAKLGIKNLHFYPFQPAESMAAFYRSADVLVFPTMQDVWGLVANEASLSGLPVLCSKYAGCAHELFPSECIFDPSDSDAFVAALRRAVEGKLPRGTRARLKTSREVADLIVAEVASDLRRQPSALNDASHESKRIRQCE